MNKSFITYKFKELVYYKWKYLPCKNKTNYMRHILYHHYHKDCLDIYEEALNINIKDYINKNKEYISNENVKDLISKNLYNIVI